MNCVAQGAVYVGGAVGVLQVMAARAAAKRQRDGSEPTPPAQSTEPTPAAVG